MTSARLSRRQVLTFAGLTLGVGVIELAGSPWPAAAAPAAGQLLLQPVADQPVAVLSGDSTAPAVCPRQLAVRVVSDGVVLPAGTRLSVTFDPRLFAALPTAAVTRGRRFVLAESTITATTSGPSTCTVTFKEGVPADGDLIVVVGTAHPLLYPRDLVRRPADATADLASTPRSARAQRSLQPARPATLGGPRTPWGIELTGGWDRQTWDGGRFWYYHPVQVSMRSVGPGKAPVAASFAISVDPRLVRDVAVGSIRLNQRPYHGAVRLRKTTRTPSVYRTEWQSSVMLKPDDVLDVLLRVAPLTPSGPLPSIKHPVVTLTMGTDIAQRQTGQNSFTRLDSVWQ